MSTWPPIVGTSRSADGADSVGVDQAVIYRAVAREFLEAAEMLAGGHPTRARAVAHLCGHALEVALKSALVGHRSESAIKRIGHDLHAAWSEVQQMRPGLGSMEQEVDTLSKVHSAPYPARYQPNSQGVVLPNPQRLVEEVRRALEAVAPFV